ncbi:zinc-dependent alcohol dehydrogenase [Alterisphingorhabdus coralli]|uniref:Alcohol dehydrogenase catalytic domain-containing protein n=1 Tax=Alterisphingorhabdus coralli TaxID=3071408 RepID=A0AA97I1S9_9SPHN|nr:alcohol dehydrogenase catalytic domain-containing protein [Parasphingorhabdus sp. SCSIO 66989]WOE75065.1 alcohol dehydrogenase catalytic domain-containing protein [Parasphingorhabdus sp. SCSIO 66989]
MRQLYYEGPRTLVWHDVPEPTVQADHEVLVSTIAATTCDVDFAVIMGLSPFQPPFSLGHESIARVVDMGDAVHGFEIGDIVSVPYHRSCGTCGPCKDHLPLHCDQNEGPLLPTYGFPHAGEWGGMFSEKYRVPWASRSLVKLPENVDPLAAVSLGDNLTDAWSTTVPHIRKKPGAKVLITSFGGYGLYAAQWALAADASLVTYVDHDLDRLRLAEKLGAHALEWDPRLRSNETYDVIVNARMGQEPLEFALRSAAPGAICHNCIIFFENIPLPLGPMHTSGVTFISTYCHARNFMEQTAEDLAANMINPRLVESEIVALDDAPERLAMPSHKPILLFEQGLH